MQARARSRTVALVSTYVYDQAWHSERARLAGIEAMWDPGSRRVIGELGIDQGARVLEIGAGGGALVEWLCEQVGASGQVVATDVDTRFVEAIERPNLSVLTHDIVAEPPPPGGFDLIHSRMVLEHLAERDAVLDKLAGALAPGGVLLIEDYDFGSYDLHPPSEAGIRVADQIVAFMEANGYERMFGRELPQRLRERGLAEVDADCRLLLLGPDHPGLAFFRLTLEQLGPVLVSQGRLEQSEVDQVLAEFGEPGHIVVTPTMVAAHGRAA
jgi:SAM-dependent methyltransferase